MQADIYSLGVLIYQLAVGDFRRALAPGWERGVAGRAAARGSRELRRRPARTPPGERPRGRRPAARPRGAAGPPARGAPPAGALRGPRSWPRGGPAPPALGDLGRRGRRPGARPGRLPGRAGRAFRRARRGCAAEKSERVAEFLTGLFVDLDPLESLGGQASARDLLDGGAARIDGAGGPAGGPGPAARRDEPRLLVAGRIPGRLRAGAASPGDPHAAARSRGARHHRAPATWWARCAAAWTNASKAARKCWRRSKSCGAFPATAA